MRPTRVLILLLVFGAFVAGPVTAGTTAELSPGFDFAVLGLGDNPGVNVTVNETTIDPLTDGNVGSDEGLEVGENATDSVGFMNTTDPDSAAGATEDVATDDAKDSSDLFRESDAPVVLMQQGSVAGASGENDKNDKEETEQSSSGDQSQSGGSGSSVGGEIALPVDPVGLVPGELLLMVAEKTHATGNDVIRPFSPPTNWGEASPPLISDNSFVPVHPTHEDPNERVVTPGFDHADERRPSPVPSSSAPSSVPHTGSTGNEPTGPSGSERPGEGNRIDPVRPVVPKAMEPTEAASPGYVLPIAVGALAGLAILAFRFEYLLKLLQLFGLRLFSHIRKDAVLKHPTRSRIFTAIQQNPGVQVQELADLFALNPATARYHVSVLDRTEMIVTFQEGKKSFFYPKESVADPEALRTLKSLPNPLDQAIVDCLERSPGITREEVAQALGIHPRRAHRRLSDLVERGVCMVEQKDSDSKHCFRLAQSRALSNLIKSAWRDGSRFKASGPTPQE